ncbi:MAG: hypothetical protein F6K14_15800 [Symploca sp. SIO2C1]|nr:hypothetical protein [Symploca sp. SIO2C1]
MNFEAVFKVTDTIVFQQTGKHLNDVQRAVIEGTWQGLTYEKIADADGYTPGYLKQDVGPKLWRLLAEALEEEVNKKNFRTIIKRRFPSGEASSTVLTESVGNSVMLPPQRVSEKRGGETSEQTRDAPDAETRRMEIPTKISLTPPKSLILAKIGEKLLMLSFSMTKQ